MGDAGTSELFDQVRVVHPRHLPFKNGRIEPVRDGPDRNPPISRQNDRVGNTYVFVGVSSTEIEASFQKYRPRAESKCRFTKKGRTLAPLSGRGPGEHKTL